MSSTYSTNLAIELMGTGDQAGNWGATTNVNLGTLIEQAISGYVTQAITDGADTVITIPNGATGVARNMFIECTGSLSAARNLIVPINKKLYFIYNNTSGGYAVTVKVSGQTGVSVPNGAKMVLVSNGTDIVSAENYLVSLTAGTVSVSGTLGVTGTTTLTGAAVLNGAVSGTGISAYLASPPAIGGTAAAAGSFTTVTASSTVTATGAVSGSAVSDSLSNVRNIPLQTKSAPYTLVATDTGQCITTNSGVTVPASVFAANNVVTIYNNSGSSITITQGSSMTLQFAGQATSTTGNRTLALYGIATVLFLSASSAVITGVGMT